MKSILIVEDEKLLGEMYKEKFSQEGFAAFLEKDEEGVFNFLKDKTPDLILLDILLPRRDGLDIAKRLKQDSSLRQIKIIAFSNLDDPSTKKRAKEIGVEEYLIKTNFTPSEIVKEIKNMLNVRRKM